MTPSECSFSHLQSLLLHEFLLILNVRIQHWIGNGFKEWYRPNSAKYNVLRTSPAFMVLCDSGKCDTGDIMVKSQAVKHFEALNDNA